MSERKVLNKYYPPDFDPTKIPKLKGPRNKTFNIRIMAPFNMRCNTCGEYIYKGKKFNSRKETVEDEDYLGLHIHRFYIKCPRCVAEIAFKTDPENTDYALEAGATRNFEAAKTAMAQAVKDQKAKEEEELNNPMKVLENRTKASRNEMERIENLEELRELNARHAKVDHETMLKKHAVYEEQLKRLQDEEDEQLVRRAFGKETCKRLADDSDDDDDSPGPSRAKIPNLEKASDLLLETPAPSETASTSSTSQPISSSASKVASTSKAASTTNSRDSLRTLVKPKQSSLKGLVVKKKPVATTERTVESNSANSAETAPVSKVSKHEQSETSDGPKTESGSKGALSLLGSYSEKEDNDLPKTSAKGALSLLGNYSESDESD